MAFSAETGAQHFAVGRVPHINGPNPGDSRLALCLRLLGPHSAPLRTGLWGPSGVF